MRLTLLVCSAMILFTARPVFGQTSWKGTKSTDWSNAANWTNGVPTATVDAIVGDANFIGSNQPGLTVSSVCKSLTIGAGIKTASLSAKQSLTVYGDITIGVHGSISQQNHTISLTGNWNNSGSYSPAGGPKHNPVVSFAGSAQSINGSAGFRSLTISAGSTTKLNTPVSVSLLLTVNGMLDPGDSPTYKISGKGDMKVNGSGTILVRASTFAGNYSVIGSYSFAATSTVEYGSSTIDQTIGNGITYGNLRVSGGTTKTLGGNLPGLRGNLTVAAGTLDLAGFSANRSSSGGILTVSNGAILKIGGTNGFPSNYATRALGGTSTIVYSGANQTVSAQSYGNLVLSSSGSATKTMPGSAMTIAGSLTSDIGTGSSVSFTARASITVNGDLVLGPSTSFNGGSYSHTVGGNWTNNGTFTGGTSSVTLRGINKTIAGAGLNNFNNLTITGAGYSAATSASVSVAGNFATSGGGTFSHLPGGTGTFTMSGTGKTVGGTGISFNNFVVSGSVSMAVSLAIAGDLTVNGTFTSTGGTVSLRGASNAIAGTGTIAFNALSVTGTITTARNFSMKSDLSVGGTLTAAAGTVSFTGSSTLSGTANLYNVTLSGTRLQLGSGSTLGLSGALALSSGTFDVATTAPNTVNYNSSGPQTVTTAVYHNLTLSGSGTKTAAGALTVNGNLTVNSGAAFTAGGYTHKVYGNWINMGSFTAGTSVIQFLGSHNVSITGVTTFNGLTLNKASSVNLLQLNNDINVAALTMTSGSMRTGANKVTITSTRTGNGIIIGTIVHTHAFSGSTPYAFEGPNNTIAFTAGAAGVTSVSVTVRQALVTDFPFGGSINRDYNVGVSSSAGYASTLRLHYEDPELNGNRESLLRPWHFNGSSWSETPKSGSDSAGNWVEQTGLASLDGRWTLSEDLNVARWTGASGSAWEDPANWTAAAGAPSFPPAPTDIVDLGGTIAANQPALGSAVTVKNMVFESAQSAALTLSAGGALTTKGNTIGSWAANASHTIDVGAQNLTIGGALVLSDGTNGHAINLKIGSGSTTVVGSLIQSGTAAISWSGPGNLIINADFTRTSGSFNAGSGTVTYVGSASQDIAGGISYNNLAINKSSGTAALVTATTANGDLSVTGGTFLVDAPLAIAGAVGIGAGATLDGSLSPISVGGDWNRSGSFVSGSGTVVLTGSSLQSVSPTTFNNLTVSKSGGSALLTGDLPINGDLTVSAGTLDLALFTANRTSIGGTFALADWTTLRLAGANNFPINYATVNISSKSTVEYYGSVPQIVAPVTYGNLTFSNGGGSAKTLSGNTTVAGNLLISGGATFDAGSFALTLDGNWTNNGAFAPSSSLVILAGTSNTLNGNTAFNDLTVTGNYSATGDITVNGTMTITGSYQAAGTSTTFSGDFFNMGSFLSNGTVTFTGTAAQSIELDSGFVSTGTVNFNGSVAPNFVSLTSPTFDNVNVNNTGGIAPNTDWLVTGDFIVGAGASFIGGPYTYTIGGTFTNNGTVSSDGTLIFDPSNAVTLSLGGSSFSSTGLVDFGGTGSITVAGGPLTFSSVEITNTGAGGVTPLSDWTVTGDLFIAEGSTLNGGSGLVLTVSGDWTNNGTFSGGTSTVVLNGPDGTINGIGSTTFDNLTITGGITALADFTVTGNFIDNGTFNDDNATITFAGNSSSTIGGSITPLPFDQLIIDKSSATTTLASNITGLEELTVVSGTLNLAGFTVTQNDSGGTLTLDAGAILILGGSNGLPLFDTYVFDPASIIVYGGSGTQTLSTTPTYGSLDITGGTVVAGGNLTITGDLTISGGTFVGGSDTISIGGDWKMTGGTFSNAGTTILFNGAGPDTIGSTGAFSNITVDLTSGTLSLVTNVVVDGVLNLVNGVVVTGADTVIIAPGGSVTRTGGYVDGNLEKYIAAGTASATFEIGDANNYTPVNISFTNVTSPGSITASTTPGEHPSITSSRINPSKDVNRYWTLKNNGTAFSGYDATFNFVPADVDPGANPYAFIGQKFDLGTWITPTVGTRTATSTQMTGLTSFSDFAVGENKPDTIVATSGANGSISPSAVVVVNYGSDTTFSITPAAGCHVADVVVDGNPVGPVLSYKFTNVTSNHTIAASFAVTTDTILSSAGTNGSINPAGTTVVNYGGSQSYTFVPNAGYHISDAVVDGNSIGAVGAYAFTNVTTNHTVSVSFAIDQLTIAASSGANGSITPAGGVSVAYGGSQSFSIVPNPGYNISDVVVDGFSVGAVSSYNFASVTGDHSIIASFTVNGYTVTATSGLHGAIAPPGPISANAGDNLGFTMTPDAGYHIQSVLVDGVSQGTVAAFTFTNITANHTIRALFAIDQFTLTASSGANGSVTPAGSTVVNYGQGISYAITPSTGYRVADVLVDGSSVGAGASYAFANVQGNHTITATFAIQAFTIAASAEAHGSISPVGAVAVNFGGSQSFTITPDSGYYIADLTVDSVSVGAQGTHTFTNVIANHTIAATFAIQTFTITAAAGPHGSISPAGAVSVTYGASQTFTITPDPGYYIADLSIDSINAGTQSGYTFTNVTSNHSIAASFGTHPTPQLTGISSSAAFRGETVNLMLTGANFVSCWTRLNVGAGIVLDTLIVHSADTLFATLTVGAGTIPGSTTFTVTNIPPGGGTSNGLTFTVRNRAPGAFHLLAPANGDTLVLKATPAPIVFSWKPSANLDIADTLTYILHIPGTPVGDSVTVKSDTTVSLAGLMSSLTPHTTYSWSVSVTDGYDTVAATDTFTFTTSDGVLASASEGKNLIPKEYALHQNFPNPFNPVTKIRFDLPRQSVVTLAVYNVLGQQVVQLIDGELMNAGVQEIGLDASNLGSGIYFYRLAAEDRSKAGAGKEPFVRTHKMILLK